MEKNKLLIGLGAAAGLIILAFMASTFGLLSGDPKVEDCRKVFENLVKKQYDPAAEVKDFNVTRFWRIEVEGFGHRSVEFYFNAKVAFPKGANLDCKPVGGVFKEGCASEEYFSTTIRNVRIKGRQYIEPGRVIDFSDETRFDQDPKGWKGQDDNIY